jgi:hypothetical protein
MIMKKVFATSIFLIACCVYAQNNVGIGTATPDVSAKIDINTSLDAANQKKGFLPPMISLANTTDGTSFSGLVPAGPAHGLLVYNTNALMTGTGAFGIGYYYNSGTKASPIWSKLAPSNDAWLLLGNTGITQPAAPATYGTSTIGAAENFLGTRDGKDLILGTSNLERLRINSAGLLGIGVNPTNGFQVRVEGVNNIGGYFHSGAAGSTESYATLARPNWEGVSTYAYNDDGVQSYTQSSFYYGVYGRNLAGTGTGVFGTGGTYGVEGYTPSISAGTYGVRGSWSSTKYGYLGGRTPVSYYVGAYGTVDGATDFSVMGWNTNGSGTAVVGAGNSVPVTYYLGVGSGGAFTGTQYGAVGFATSNTGGLSRAGGYFALQSGASFAYVAAVNTGNVVRKIEGNGTVNTTVKDTKGNAVVLSCTEAPENFFQDFGNGQLVNGKAHIKLDPIFSKNIIVSSEHPLRVFVQLEGDCNGVYVANKSANGFDVSELMNGRSNVAFTWSVTANRADELLPDGTVSQYSSERFAAAMGAAPVSSAKMANSGPGEEVKWKENSNEAKQKKEPSTISQ